MEEGEGDWAGKRLKENRRRDAGKGGALSMMKEGDGVGDRSKESRRKGAS